MCALLLMDLPDIPDMTRSINFQFPDPIYGTITVPDWFAKIDNLPAVRRMMFIRQLGLKAYIDFPGAIHTRYAHVLGVMHLAEKMIDILYSEQMRQGKETISQNLKDNKNTIMAAAFLHDIAHGPFSHALDYVVTSLNGIGHEELASKIIPKEFRILENYGIPLNPVVKIINDKHEYPFISDIVNGPLDADKLDYLLRDSHNIGYRYSFDLDHFINLYTILGYESELNKCLLGLTNSDEAVVTSEIFSLIWKSMYDLIYYKENSRIAEKMLEKATLFASSDNPSIKKLFSESSEYMKLNDEMLLNELDKISGYPAKIVKCIRERELYTTEFGIKSNEEKLNSIPKILVEDPSVISEKVTLELCSKLKLDSYSLICDIYRSRSPREIFIYDKDNPDEPMDMRSKSAIINSIKPITTLKVYKDRSNPKISVKSDELKDMTINILEEVLESDSN